MSADDLEEVEGHLHVQVSELAKQVEAITGPAKSLQKIAPAIYLLLCGAAGFGVWLGTLEWRLRTGDETVANHTEKDKDHDTDLRNLQMWRERAEAQAVTSVEIAEIVAGLKDTLANLDKRLVRTESTLENVGDQLDRIETRLTQPTAGL